MLLGNAGAEYLLNVIHVIPAVHAVAHGLDVLLGEIRNIFGAAGNFTVGKLVHHLRYIIIVGELGTVHELGEIGVHGCTYGAVVGNVGIALGALSGGDDNYAAGSLKAIYRGRCTVLKYGDALDIGRINIVDAAGREAVHNVRHAVHATADAQRSLVHARFAGFLHRGDTCQFTCEHLRYVGCRSL